MAGTSVGRRSLVSVAKQATRDEAKARQKNLDSFVNFQMKMGIGADNPLTGANYGFNPITRIRTLLEWIHRGSWIGGVAVDLVADDMTRAGVTLLGDIKPEDIQKMEESATVLQLWNKINSTFKWARLYGGCLGVHMIDGQDPTTPLRVDTIRKGQYKGLLVLDRWMVEPSMGELIQEMGPNMGLPKYYTVTPQGPGLVGMKIHHSRCIRIEGMELPYWQKLMENMWGLSVLERLYDRMVAFDSATTGAAQLVYKSYLRTLKIEGLRDVVAAGGKPLDGLTKYVDMMRRFQGIEGMAVLDAKDEFTQDTHAAFSGLGDALLQFGQQLSGALQIPLVRLFGQSPAGLSSTGESDLRTYYDGIKQQQVTHLKVPVTDMYRMLAASEGIKLPDGFGVEFNSLWELKDEEKATVANNIVDAVIKAYEGGFISAQGAMRELKQSAAKTGIFSNITDEMIANAEETLPPSGEEALPNLGVQGEKGGTGKMPEVEQSESEAVEAQGKKGSENIKDKRQRLKLKG